MYNPENPLPSALSDEAGRTIFADTTVQQECSDVLVYTSLALEEELKVTGLVKFMLYAATDAMNTDFSAG